MESDLRKVISEFVENPLQGSRALRLLYEKDQSGFFEMALPALREEPDSPGFHYLLTLLLSQGLLLRPLCNPHMFSLDEAKRIGRRLRLVDSHFDVRLLRTLVPNNGDTSTDDLERVANTPSGLRLLEILGEISDGTRVLPVMTRLLNHTDSRVRSKAALLVGRSNKNHKWVQDKLCEPDARVRANAVESLWGSDSAGSRAVFLSALGDADNRVVANALLALYRLGDPACVRLILEMLTHSDAGFRVSAVWVMGESGDQRFMPTLARLISEPEAELRGNAFRALAKIKKSMAARGDADHLDIFVGPPHREQANWVQFTAAVRCRRDAQIPDLNGTNFAMWEDSVLIREYTVEQRGKHEPVAIALGMPRILDRGGPPQVIQECAIERALRYKRGQDIWTVLKYVTASQESPNLSDTGGLSPADEDLSSLRMRFTANPDKIEGAVALPGTRMACGSDLHQAIRTLIDATAHMRAARNIVLICQSPHDTFTRDVEAEIEAAYLASIAVHIITPWPTNSMREMCSRTSGTLVAPPTPGGIPEALEGLCASLLNSYEVRFQSENPAASKLRLQIYTEAFTGETFQSLR